jgi:integrase
VACELDGSPVHPQTISYGFTMAVRAAGLPKIRLHDLGHTPVTLALEARVHPRIVQERLGHATVSITLDTYSHVDLDLQAAAAARVAALLTAADRDEPGLPRLL